MLGLKHETVIKVNPDKPNICLYRLPKLPNKNIQECAQAIYMPELDRLAEEKSDYPVSLFYMPLEWMTWVQAECIYRFGRPDILTMQYALLYSTQDHDVVVNVVIDV